jgi:hypothetical protein
VVDSLRTNALVPGLAADMEGGSATPFSRRSPVRIARSAALVPPDAEATVPPVPFIHITSISPVSRPAQRARPAALKLLNWRFNGQGAAPPAPAGGLRAGDGREFGARYYQDLTALLSRTCSGFG